MKGKGSLARKKEKVVEKVYSMLRKSTAILAHTGSKGKVNSKMISERTNRIISPGCAALHF
jgi:hypothetical protein